MGWTIDELEDDALVDIHAKSSIEPQHSYIAKLVVLIVVRLPLLLQWFAPWRASQPSIDRTWGNRSD